jgi:hypothetical protein
VPDQDDRAVDLADLGGDPAAVEGGTAQLVGNRDGGDTAAGQLGDHTGPAGVLRESTVYQDDGGGLLIHCSRSPS